MIRTYTELSRLHSFEERYAYLKLNGSVGVATFGFDRYINQRFYRSQEWKSIRQHVAIRDNGCDLGVVGYEIFGSALIHHINPIDVNDVVSGVEGVLDPEYLITTTQKTHNAIHYGDQSKVKVPFRERAQGDTKLW